MEALKAHYGAKADHTLSALSAYAGKIAQDHGDLAETVEALTSTAAGVRLLDLVRTGALKPGVAQAMAGAADMAGAPMTEADVRALMTDPRYWRDHDPAVVAQVRAGFKRLVPE